MSLSNRVITILLISLYFGISYAEDNTLTVKAGKLSVLEQESGEKVLKLNNTQLKTFDTFSLIFEKNYKIANTDVVLLTNNSGGTACPAQYLFVSVTDKGVTKLSPEFGTCSDLIESTQKDSKITVSMPNMSGKGKTKYEFSNDQLFENGKPMKNEAGLQAKPVEENTILINGRGQVLTSGNPDKKILKCVENRVEKEKSYADGWEDKIMSECQSKK